MTPSDASDQLFERAKQSLVGGVNSPVRAFQAVGGTPPFLKRGEGAYVIDADGNRYVDYVLSYGPLILGHAHPRVVAALKSAVERGTSFGAPTELEVELAEKIKSSFASIDKIRFVNSGTEAAMSALRLARAYTERTKIVKFQGCYHGHADLLLVQAGSGVATLGLPDSPGVPKATTSDTLVAQYNDAQSVAELFEHYPNEIAAVILEPVAGNMGVVPPIEGFLQELRGITSQHGVLLIFDEVMTGYRVHPAGAQVLYGIEPDLTVLGKVIGGGLPVGAYGGPARIMNLLAPEGPVYQAGTLSGNPLAMQAGLTTLEVLSEAGQWERAASQAENLSAALLDLAQQADVAASGHQVGTMLSLFFRSDPPTNYETAQQADIDHYAKFMHSMLRSGAYLAPSQFEAAFVSTAHDDAAINRTLDAAERAFAEVSGS